MHDDNPNTTEAIRILRDRGWTGMSEREAADVLSSDKYFRLSNLDAIPLDDAIQVANDLRSYDRKVLQLMKEMRA